MKNLSTRLKEYIEKEKPHLSIREFERQVGWSSSSVNNLKNNLTTKKVNELKTFDPTININWLLTGEGTMTIKENPSDDFMDFLDSLPEEKKHVYDPVEVQLKKLLAKKADTKPKAPDGVLVDDGDTVLVPCYKIPIIGFAGLQNAFFDTGYIEATFTAEYMRLPKRYKTSLLIEIESSGYSMPERIPPKTWVTGEIIPDLVLKEYKFLKDKIYIFMHPIRGILFKTAENLPDRKVLLKSDNPDKTEYPDEIFHLGEFKKVLIVRARTFLD